MDLKIEVWIDKDTPNPGGGSAPVLGMRGDGMWDWEARIDGRSTFGRAKTRSGAKGEALKVIEDALGG